MKPDFVTITYSKFWKYKRIKEKWDGQSKQRKKKTKKKMKDWIINYERTERILEESSWNVEGLRRIIGGFTDNSESL